MLGVSIFIAHLYQKTDWHITEVLLCDRRYRVVPCMHHGMDHWEYIPFRCFRHFRSVMITVIDQEFRSWRLHFLAALCLTGGFWIAYAIIVQPSMGIAASFASADAATNSITAAAAGAATRPYNSGLALYFTTWGIICAIYFVASLRTYVFWRVFGSIAEPLTTS